MASRAPNARKLGLAKLKASGLDADDAKKLGMEFLDPAKSKAAIGHALPTIKLTYYTAQGKPRADTARYRLLAEPAPGAFGTVKKLPKYLQTPGSPPAAYFPTSYDWPAVFAENDPLVITEGELKAACACKFDVATIGLGGVSSWRSKKLGWGLLPELKEIPWGLRRVTIVYDSDAAINPEVARAATGLARTLRQLGAIVSIMYLPDISAEGKTGLDDFLVARSAEALRALVNKAASDDLSLRLHEFNSTYAMILNPGFILNTETEVKYDPGKWRTSIVSNEWADEETTNAKGESVLKKARVGDKWVEWPARRQYEGLTYEPGQGRVIGGHYNWWGGWGVEPVKGELRPWRDLLDYLFDGERPEALQWFERWCLYPMRYPGIKMPCAVGVWSFEQGLGKSLTGLILGRVHGANFSLINQRQLESEFNSWCANRTLVMVDDVSAFDSRSKADILKTIISQPEVLINTKYIPEYKLPDHANMYLTSNHANAFYLEDRDRRMFVHEVVAPRADRAFYDKIYEWKDGGGPAALLHYAQNEMDFGDFDPFAPALMTRSKAEMILHGKNELELWVRELQDDPYGKICVNGFQTKREAFTAFELVELFDVVRKGPTVGPQTMGLKLRAAFAHPVNLTVEGSLAERFYVVKDAERWRSRPKAELRKHIIQWRARERGNKKY